MDPRKRKNKPDDMQFSSFDELSKFFESGSKNVEKTQKEINELLDKTGEFDFRGGIKGDAIFKILTEVEVFCPHISVYPYNAQHFIAPQGKVAFCVSCAPEWADFLIAQAQTDQSCDYCKENVDDNMFTEITFSIGYAHVTLNVGRCCLDKVITPKED
jgi:hypothetical protein